MTTLLQFPPFAKRADETRPAPPAVPEARYVEFCVASNFSFLRGASSPEHLLLQAVSQDVCLAGIGLCDRNTVAGVVRAHLLKRENALPLRYHPGARLVFADGTPDILAYPRDRAGWGRLCRLLTRGNLRAEKGDCILYREDLLEHAEGLELIVMPACTRDCPPAFLHTSRAFFGEDNSRRRDSGKATNPRDVLGGLCEAAPGRVRLAAMMLYRGNDRARLAGRAALAREAGAPLIAVNDVLYHHHEQRELQDVLTCIRQHVTIDAAGRRLAVNAERYLKSGAEMVRLFGDYPDAIAETCRLSDALAFSLDELKYEYPDESIPGFASAQEALVHLTWAGAKERYPDGITEEVEKSLANEFALIAGRNYAPYFLTVYDIVRFARQEEILCQGRGSAANSTVCYCLGITSVDPVRGSLLFERFISTERDEPPDIDVDFEHERREEVIQYIYGKYGRERTGIAATVISYRGRSAIREVGKVFGLSEDMIGALASSIWGMGGGNVRPDALRGAGLDPQSPRVAKIIALTKAIQGFPRHLSQHVGGFVITRSRLDEVMPIMNGAMEARTHVEWDKDDLDALGILKVDVLGLGMLTCIRKAFELVERHYPDWEADESSCVAESASGGARAGKKLTLATLPSEKGYVYDMLCRADSLGVFQVESRAQMSMLPRLRPRAFYDLVIEVAIVRPGPIQGNMVHPYLRRRERLRRYGEEPDYPSPTSGDKDELRNVLHKTLGVPLFQEQAMKIAIVAGGFTPGEADRLRRAMATFKRTGTIGTFRVKMVDGMVGRGYPREFAERCFSQIEGFGEYGFPESHAASFALLVYASAWLKCRYPDVFAAALLNAQPMGFYAPSQIVRDVREHGVAVRAVDVNHSDYDATLEPGPAAAGRVHALHAEMRGDIRSRHAIRLGLRAVNGLGKEDTRRIVAARDGLREAPQTAAERRPFTSVRDVWSRTGLPLRLLERLADADAFGSLGLTRRQALWAVKALGRAGDQDDLPLFAAVATASSPAEIAHREPAVALPPMRPGEEVVNDYRFLNLSLRAHPAAFLRADLDAMAIMRNERLRAMRNGDAAFVSGLVTVRQRPGSANGVIFMTIEDESAIANIIVWPAVFERFRAIVLGARYVAVHGRMQQESGVIHVVADRIEDCTGLLGRLTEDLPPLEALARADEVKHPPSELHLSLRHAASRPPHRSAGEISRLAVDLDVPARGTAHAPVGRGRGRA